VAPRWQGVVLPGWGRQVVRSSNRADPELKIAVPAPLFAIGLEAITAMHSLIGFDVSADGQRLRVPVITSSERSEIVVIQNWEAAVQRNRGMLN
jgi:hypothetical protein